MGCLGRRPFPAQVCGYRLCDCCQQRKLDRHLGLRPTRSQYAGLPVQILQSKPENFGGPKTIRSQQQHDSKVTFARRFGSRDRPQNPLDITPWQSAWGLLEMCIRDSLKICRSLALVSPVRNLRTGRGGAGSLDAGGLGRGNQPAVRPPAGSVATSRDECSESARGFGS